MTRKKAPIHVDSAARLPDWKVVAFFGACFVFLYLQVFYLPVYPIFYEADHVNLLNDAKRMIEGEFIYRDYFEFVFPGAVTLYAGLMEVFGPKYWLVNLVIIAHGMAAAILGLMISRQILGKTDAAYVPSAVFIFMGFRWFGIDGEHRFLSPIFICLALLILLKGLSFPRLAAAGVCCAFASFFTQQRGILAITGIGLFLIADFWLGSREVGKLIKSGLILTISFLLTLTLLLIPFILIAGPDVFFLDTIGFLATYAKDSEFNSLQSYIATFEKIAGQGYLMLAVSLFYAVLVPLVFVVVFIAILLERPRTSFAKVSPILLVCIVGFIISVGTSGPNVPRLFQTALPALVALSWLADRTGFLRPAFARAFVAGLAIFGIALGIRIQTSWEMKLLDTPSGQIAIPSAVVSERYEWLLENARPDDQVYEVYNSHVNFPLGLRNPSRMSILLNTAYSPPEHVAWAIEDLKRARPRYIIWDGTWTDELGQLTEGERLQPLYQYLLSNYRLVQSFTPYDNRKRQIWERLGPHGN